MGNPPSSEGRGDVAPAAAHRPRPGDEQLRDAVPLFGSWCVLHTAVLVCALVVMALLALFSRWPF